MNNKYDNFHLAIELCNVGQTGLDLNELGDILTIHHTAEKEEFCGTEDYAEACQVWDETVSSILEEFGIRVIRNHVAGELFQVGC